MSLRKSQLGSMTDRLSKSEISIIELEDRGIRIQKNPSALKIFLRGKKEVSDRVESIGIHLNSHWQ